MTVRTVQYPSKRFIKRLISKLASLVVIVVDDDGENNELLEKWAYVIFRMIERYVLKATRDMWE